MGGNSIIKNSYVKDGFRLEKGTGCIYRFPEPMMFREAKAGTELKTLVITVPPQRRDLFPVLQRPGVDSGQVFPHSDGFYLGIMDIRPDVNTLIRQILHPPIQGHALNVYLEGKVLELIALQSGSGNENDSGFRGVSAMERDQLNRVRNFLVRDLKKTPSLEALSRAAGMSHPLLNRLFRRGFNVTAFEYLRSYRLEKACRLIEENRMSLTQIAYETGFASSSHFSRSFLARYGLQPCQYRKNLLSDPFFQL